MTPLSRKKHKSDFQLSWESEARSSPKQEGRALILDAAARAFMVRGYVATTVDDVADMLGVTKGQIYHYYRSKIDLYFDVAMGAFHMAHERIKPLAERKDVNALERLRLVAHAYAMEIMRNYPFHRVALQATQFQIIARRTAAQERAAARILVLRNKLEAIISSLIEAAVHEGSLRVSSVPLAAKAAIGSLVWLIVWFDPERSVNAEECEAIASNMAEFVVAGLLQPSGSVLAAPG